MSEWMPIEEYRQGYGKVLVTNNPKAKANNGQMSHVWLGYPTKNTDTGEYSCFDCGDRLIYALKMFCLVPQPPEDKTNAR